MATTRRSAKARLRAAQSETAAAAAALRDDAAALKAWLARHRTALIVSGGFAAGFALSSLPRRLWSGVGAFAAGTAAAVARSLLTPMLAGAVLARRTNSGAAPARANGAAASQ